MIRTKKMTLFLSSLLFSVPLTHIQAEQAPMINPMPSMAPMPPMPSSEQDINQIVQELEKATKEIDTFVKALPPAEQEEFNRIVQQVEEKMSQTDPAVLERFLTNQMSPEELDQFLGNVFEGITPPEQKPGEDVAKPKPTPKKEEKLTPKEISKIDRALDTINTIIKRTDSFIIKTQELPELSSKVKGWGKRGILYDWEPSFEWSKVKKDIESLRQGIQKLIEKDPKDGTYKFLNDFVEQNALVNNVEKLKTTLVEYEPAIETSVFGLEKMTSTAKNALTRSISGFTEALYRLKITEDLNKIFEKYEPRAKELREEKEHAEKVAEGAGQRSRYTPKKEMVVAGSEDTAGLYSGYSGFETPDYSNFYTGSPSYDSSYDSHTPSHESSSGKTAEETAKGDKNGGGDKGKASANGGKSEGEKNGKEEPKKSTPSKGPDKKAPAPRKESESIEKDLKDTDDFMSIAGLSLKHEEKLRKIGEYLADDKTPVDENLLDLPLSYLEKVDESISQMKQELTKKQDKEAAVRVQKRLEDIVKKHKSAFDLVIDQIKEVESMDPITRYTKIPLEKRIAFLGELRPVAKAAKGSVPTKQPQEEIRVDLSELDKAWQTVQKAVKEFSEIEPKTPAPLPVNPIPVEKAPEKPVEMPVLES